MRHSIYGKAFHLWVRFNISNPEGFEGSFDGCVRETGLYELKTVPQWGLVLVLELRNNGVRFFEVRLSFDRAVQGSLTELSIAKSIEKLGNRTLFPRIIEIYI